MPTDLPFNLNAPARTGQGPYGLVPGNIGLPGVYQDVAGVFPNLSGNIGALSRSIGSELAGELDPNTVAMLQNTAAQFGIGQGVPLSPFAGSSGLRHLGLTAEAQRARGAQNLLSSLPTLARTLTVQPETQLAVADRNATLNAAPDPAKAAAEAQRLFDLYMAKLTRGGGGGAQFGGGGGSSRGPAGGTGVFDSPWAPFQPEAVRGGQPYTPPYQGTGITWGTQGTKPQDLWGDFAGGFPGPEGGSVATPGGGGFTDWFNDPFIGGGGGMFGLGTNTGGGATGEDTDFWDAFWDAGPPDQPDFDYLNEWGAWE